VNVGLDVETEKDKSHEPTNLILPLTSAAVLRKFHLLFSDFVEVETVKCTQNQLFSK